MALTPYSESNLANSLAAEVGARLLAENYLVYWHEIDAVQTPDGWYFEYTAKDQLYALDSQFGARLANTRGLVTLARSISTDRRFPTRPTTDGTIDGPEEVPVPWMVLEVGTIENGELVELGGKLRFRTRPVFLYGAARNPTEQSWFCERLAEWFDEAGHFEVLDHDGGSLAAVGSVEVVASETEWADVAIGPDAKRFEFLLDARVEFVA